MELEDLEQEHENVQRHAEHGQEWVTCLACGAVWSIVECVNVRGEEYENAEEIEHGDGSCEKGGA